MRPTISILIMLIITGSVFLTAAGTGGGYKVGDKARDFKLKNIDGNFVSLSDYKDAKGFIVIFSCNHCPYVKAYESRMVALDKKFSAKGFPVIAINPNDAEKYPSDSYENMKKNASEKGFTFPYLVDETQDIAKAYGAQKTPHVYVLEKTPSGNIVRYIGAIDDNVETPEDVTKRYVEDAVHALLNNKEVPVTETKAVGCSVKYK